MIFISHNEQDKPLADAFVDLLQTGLSIHQDQIFCTSLKGLGIPKGKTFEAFIKEKIKNARFVIALLTPLYYESYFCMCELGASWVLEPNFFPMLVPPLTYRDLKAVLANMQAAKINDASDLDMLRDALVEDKIGNPKVQRWNVKRDEFIKKFDESISTQLLGASNVPAAKFRELEAMHTEAQDVIQEKEKEIKRLNEYAAELKKLKNKAEVSAVDREFDESSDVYDALVAEVQKLTDKLPSCVVDALYHSHNGLEWHPSQNVEGDDIWDKIDSAEKDQMLEVWENRVSPNRKHPKVRNAINKIDELHDFLESEEASDLVEQFEDENEYPLSLRNKEYWDKHLT
ncbi:MAG: toll/interleukin-1 receptor domain-containing protein [Candidatus Melainabacteria bacterium]|nr:toll/interleukin-1 receptor domain-containing protein [Candidatus Melainabacteria bacterium]